MKKKTVKKTHTGSAKKTTKTLPKKKTVAKKKSASPVKKAKDKTATMPKNIKSIYDNGGKSIDRYTIVFTLDNMTAAEKAWYKGRKFYPAIGASANPGHAQGIFQHTDVNEGKHLGKKINWSDLPKDLQNAIITDQE